MNSKKWQNIKAVFSEIQNLPAEQRSGFLDRACAGDQELRIQVENLLDSYDENDSFLEKSAVAEIAHLFLENEAGKKESAESNENAFFQPGHILNERYEIIYQLGKGGMGEVYLSNDKKISRKVSLKVINSNIASNRDNLRRFQQEARAVSALNHPHIMTIYEFDKTADEIHFIVGEFIDGKTLTAYLNQEKLSISEILEIAMQVASALSAAHEVGIIHRDIKPDNIMVRRDHYIKVLDFGLAKLPQVFNSDSLGSEATTREIHITNPGAVMGTAAYMSPEQARGIKIDIRTDLWSLGVVIYEMLTGQRPFPGATPTDVIVSVLREEPLPLSSYLKNVPAELEWIISKTLSKKLEGRYQTADELRADLEKIKKIIILVEDTHYSATANFQNVRNKQKEKNLTEKNFGVSTFGDKVEPTNEVTGKVADEKSPGTASSIEYIFKQSRTRKIGALFGSLLLFSLVFYAAYHFFITKPETGKIDSIAVLPFENLSQDKDLAYLSEGVSANLTDRLSRLPQLKVISKNSSSKFKDSKEDLQIIASKLGVRAIVTGKTSQIGDDLIIKYEIVDTAENRHLTGGQYYRKAKDLLKVENEIPQDIARQLDVKLTDSQAKRITDNGTDDPEAFRYYLSGLVELNGPQNILGKSLELFQKAVELDPDFADARTEIASIYWQRANASGNPKQIMPKVKEETEKALAINPNLAKTHVMLAVLKEYEFDWQSAEREYLRAIELNPNLDSTRDNYAFFLSVLGRHDEALAQLDELKERDPINVRQLLTTKGIVLAWGRRFDEALQEFQKIQAVDQTVKVEDFSLGYVYGGKGMYKVAAENFKQAVEIVGGDEEYSLALVFLAASNAKIPEKKSEARVILGRLENMKGYVSPSALAIVYAALDEKDKALEALEKAYLERDVQLRFIGVGYEYDGLRQDPRFADLVKRIGLQR